jgi:hypothetical protein
MDQILEIMLYVNSNVDTLKYKVLKLGVVTAVMTQRLDKMYLHVCIFSGETAQRKPGPPHL